MDDKTLKILEFDRILSQVAAFAVSDPAKESIAGLRPAETRELVEKLLRETEEAYSVKYKYLLSPIAYFTDCTQSVDKAKIGGVLQPGELLRIAGLIRAARIAKSNLSGCGEDVVLLKEIVGCLYINGELEKAIGDCVAGENELRDDASPELKSIRRKIASANVRLKEKLASYVRSAKTSKYLQDSPMTVRDGRFVLPVKSECRSEIPGIVHDMSSSGATVFVEPFPVVDLNNEIRSLAAEEREEIERILRRLSEAVSACAESLVLAQNQCTMLDIVFAKCEYSVQTRGIKPVINTIRAVELLDARHPLIDKNKVVPVTLAIGGDRRVLVITGPNTGGKTVCLKTVGLISLMAFTGIFVPCREGSSLYVFDQIFCDIGDEQSIEQSLSTFSAHIVNLVGITDRITPDSLLLLDELGGGTDPKEGAALAIGILKYIELMQARAIITTHYGEIKEYSLVSPNLINACMQFDEKTLKPTYKLIMGLPGVSNALKIAKTLGLNDYILNAAQSSLSEETVQFERVLQHAETVRSEALRELEEARRLKDESAERGRELEAIKEQYAKKLETISSNARLETIKLVSAAEQKADEIIEHIKCALAQADNAAYLEAKRMRKKLENMRYEKEAELQPSYQPIRPESLKIGDRVAVKSLRAEGVIEKLPGKKGEALVRIGVMPMSVPVSDLARAEAEPARERKPSVHVSSPVHVSEAEVKVLGLTVSEAIEVIEPYLVSSAGGVLKIIHGKGSGALGKGIQQYLRTCPLVKSYRYGRYGEGETGVTIAELK